MTRKYRYSCVITHRESTETRKINLSFVIGWISSLNLDIEIILVEQDNFQKINPKVLPDCCKHVFARNNGLFNRAWGLNVGFRHSNGTDAIIFTDNDIIVDTEILEEALLVFTNDDSCNAVKPFNKLIDLTKEESIFLTKEISSIDKLDLKKRNPRVGTSFCSAFTIFSPMAYEEIGGFDERFIGWGGEDDAMMYKLQFLNNVYTSEDTAYHLWHERTINDSNLQPNYLNNVKILKEYQGYSQKKLLEKCRESRDTYGVIS